MKAGRTDTRTDGECDLLTETRNFFFLLFLHQFYHWFVAEVLMVKYLFVIFYLCVVMFLKLGHQLAKGKTCCAGRRGNARYKPEVDHQTYFP